jgi:hypothetical protein
VPDLALLHEILNRAGDVPDLHAWVNTVLVKQVDAVGFEPL